MDISVIVPIYGVENYIEKCLRSLFTQTKTDGVEFILVNDASPDRSMEIARKVIAEYSNLDIRIIEHPENRHIAATRQTGVDAAIGEYTIQIDSDDWCEPTMLEDMYAKAIETGADLVRCNFYESNCKRTLIMETNLIECIRLLLLYKNRNTLWLYLIRRSLYVENNITFPTGVVMGEDDVAVVKLLHYAKKIAYVDGYLYHHICNPSSITQCDERRHLAYIECTYMHENFLRDNTENYSEVYSPYIFKRKLLLKYRYLRETGLSKSKRKSLSNIYPEIKKTHILSSSAVPLYQRIILCSASMGVLLSINQIIFCEKVNFNIKRFLFKKK